MDAESLKYLYQINVLDATDLKSFISGLKNYLDQVLSVKRYRNIFLAQKRVKSKAKTRVLNSDQSESLKFLLEFHFAYELAHGDYTPMEVRKKSKNRGLSGASVAKMREGLLKIDSPIGTRNYEYAVEHIDDEKLHIAAKVAQNRLLKEAINSSEVKLWIERIDGVYYHKDKEVTFNNPAALYKKIFDLLYDYKKEGGLIEYVELQNYADDGVTKISRNSIFRALVQSDASIKEYSSLPKKVGGKKLFDRSGDSDFFIFNNKR